MIASAIKGMLVVGSGLIHESQHPSSISHIIFRFLDMSPARIDANLGIIPGFLTMYCRKKGINRVLGRQEGISRPLTQMDLLQWDRTQGLNFAQTPGIHCVLRCVPDGLRSAIPVPNR
jgi:hypothetical protein